MISWQELLGKYKESDIPAEHLANMRELLVRLNKLRTAYAKPMKPTNCYRSMEHHLRIYKDKGITDKAKIPMASKHLFGQACDLADPTGELYKWAWANQKLLAEIGLWCEEGTKGWLHCQSVPYGSYREGKPRFFKP